METCPKMWLLAGILTFLVVLQTSHGLECWQCDNARSVTDCVERGEVKTCDPRQKMVCSSEFRRSVGLGRRPVVKKGCKQKHACEVNVQQNNAQCNQGGQNSVCRACCDTDRCNMIDFWGDGNINLCTIIPAPLNGAKKCDFATEEGELGSICTFTCDPGYTLVGDETSTCTQASQTATPAFNNDTPVCQGEVPTPPIPTSSPASPATRADSGRISHSTTPPTEAPIDDCEFAPAPPENGGRTCLRARGGVTCTYFCGENESSEDPLTLTCTAATGWNGNTPTCTVRCTTLPQNPAHGIVICHGEGGIGTSCSFSCDVGYQISTPSSISCVLKNDEPRWNDTEPTCRIPR